MGDMFGSYESPRLLVALNFNEIYSRIISRDFKEDSDSNSSDKSYKSMANEDHWHHKSLLSTQEFNDKCKIKQEKDKSLRN